MDETPDPFELVVVELLPDEEQLLRQGLRHWGGPARPTVELAIAIGFHDDDDLRAQVERIASQVAARTSLTRVDWSRGLLATEIALASLSFGAALDWSTCTGIGDDDAMTTLRRLQRKLSSRRATHGVVGAVFGTRTPRPAR